MIILLIAGWLLGLGLALYASDRLVVLVIDLGDRAALGAVAVGFAVALGADAPEVTSALLALAQGRADLGLGVVVGSNIYNIAGLLGLSAVITGRVDTGPALLTPEGAVALVLTVLLQGFALFPTFHLPLGLSLLAVLVVYGVHTARKGRGTGVSDAVEVAEEMPTRPSRRRSIRVAALLLLISVAGIVLGSDIVVRISTDLGPRLHIPEALVGTFALAIATSLPNTWAAVALARRSMPAAAIATTFTSNSINAGLGVGLPAVFVSLRVSAITRSLDVPWLLGMTLAAILMLATRRALTRIEGTVLLALYAGFVVARLLVAR